MQFETARAIHWKWPAEFIIEGDTIRPKVKGAGIKIPTASQIKKAVREYEKAEAAEAWIGEREIAYMTAGLSINRLAVALLDAYQGNTDGIAQFIHERDAVRSRSDFPNKPE